MSAPFGLSATGFVAKSLSQCVADNIANLQNLFGSDIDVSADSIFGQLASVMAKPTADIWQQMLAIYTSRGRAGAEGSSLDIIAAYVGLSREQPLASSVIAFIGGSDGTLVPAGTQFGLGNGIVFASSADVTISNPGGTSAILQRITITAQLVSGTNSIPIVGPYGSYTASTSANQTFAAIATALVNAINAQSSLLGITASATGSVITLLANNVNNPYTVGTLVGNLTVGPAFNNTVFCTATATGPSAAPIGTLVNIVTPVSGLGFVTNNAAANLGQNLESDAALRLRIVTNPLFKGKATEKAISSLVLLDTAIYGMESVFVVSNRLMASDGSGRPPKSFEVYVQGTFNPTDATTLNAIAQAIYDSQPAGIQPVSTGSGGQALSGTATDQNGNTVTVPFSLPSQKWVWLWVDLTDNTEETFPANGVVAVQNALNAFGATSVISEDIILYKFYAPISTVSGILTATIYCLTTDPNPVSSPTKPGSPAVQSDFNKVGSGPYAIPTGAIATYDTSRIVVTMA